MKKMLVRSASATVNLIIWFIMSTTVDYSIFFKTFILSKSKVIFWMKSTFSYIRVFSDTLGTNNSALLLTTI